MRKSFYRFLIQFESFLRGFFGVFFHLTMGNESEYVVKFALNFYDVDLRIGQTIPRNVDFGVNNRKTVLSHLLRPFVLPLEEVHLTNRDQGRNVGGLFLKNCEKQTVVLLEIPFSVGDHCKS